MVRSPSVRKISKIRHIAETPAAYLQGMAISFSTWQGVPNVGRDQLPRSGTLQIVDHFTYQVNSDTPTTIDPQSGQPAFVLTPPHGAHVVESVLATGYRGPLNTVEFREKVEPGLIGQVHSGQSALRALDFEVQSKSAAAAQAASNSLTFQTAMGVRHSVTNLSMEAGSAHACLAIYAKIRYAWGPVQPDLTAQELEDRAEGLILSESLAQAWKIDQQALSSRDPAMAGPARQRFQQNLINRFHQANHSPQMEQLRRQLSACVDRYEAGHNSLVVAAGNDGQLGEVMREDNFGHDLRFPQGFFDNILSTRNATTVGARQLGASQLAKYSNPSANVRLTASGYLSAAHDGTSFAAPRVAAQMQQLHNQFPQKSSAQIEAILQRQAGDI